MLDIEIVHIMENGFNLVGSWCFVLINRGRGRRWRRLWYSDFSHGDSRCSSINFGFLLTVMEICQKSCGKIVLSEMKSHRKSKSFPKDLLLRQQPQSLKRGRNTAWRGKTHRELILALTLVPLLSYPAYHHITLLSPSSICSCCFGWTVRV